MKQKVIKKQILSEICINEYSFPGLIKNCSLRINTLQEYGSVICLLQYQE